MHFSCFLFNAKGGKGKDWRESPACSWVLLCQLPPQRRNLGLNFLVECYTVDHKFFRFFKELGPVPPKEGTFPELWLLEGHAGPDDVAVGFRKRILEFAALLRPVQPGPQGHDLLKLFQSGPVSQECPKLGSISVFMEHDEKLLTEFGRARELLMGLLHVVRR